MAACRHLVTTARLLTLFQTDGIRAGFRITCLLTMLMYGKEASDRKQEIANYTHYHNADYYGIPFISVIHIDI